jgi:serine protease Do
MIIRVLKIMSVCLVLIGLGAFAPDAYTQSRQVPSDRTQVQISYSPLVKQVAPSVVNIYTKRVITRNVSPFGGDPFFEQFFGGAFGGNNMRGLNQRQVESSLGTGLIVDSEGVLVTNAHVVKGAQEISVVLQDGREFDASISLSDDKTDIAILRVDTKGENLPTAKLKPSENLEVGDIVLAIGNPFGVGQTVTSGIVSALARASLDINDFNFFIQTDAAINPGNSGGPLVAMDGSVIGLNTAIYSRSGGSLGIGFAIPSEMVQTVIAAEKSGATNASALRPWIGVTGQAVTSDIANSLGLDKPQGVLVSKIHRQSPAGKAGLKVGDIITAVNSRNVNDPAEMKFRLATVALGDKADLDILRKGKDMTLRMKAIQPPEDPPRNKTKLEGNHPLSGAVVGNLNPRVGVELGIESDREGVVVLSTSRYSRLVRTGDIILAVNDDEVEDIEDLQKELRQAQKRGVFDMVVERDGRQSRIVIR